MTFKPYQPSNVPALPGSLFNVQQQSMSDVLGEQNKIRQQQQEAEQREISEAKQDAIRDVYEELSETGGPIDMGAVRSRVKDTLLEYGDIENYTKLLQQEKKEQDERFKQALKSTKDVVNIAKTDPNLASQMWQAQGLGSIMGIDMPNFQQYQKVPKQSDSKKKKGQLTVIGSNGQMFETTTANLIAQGLADRVIAVDPKDRQQVQDAMWEQQARREAELQQIAADNEKIFSAPPQPKPVYRRPTSPVARGPQAGDSIQVIRRTAQ